MEENLKHLYFSILDDKRTICGYTKYQEGFYAIELLYPLIAKRIWFGPYE